MDMVVESYGDTPAPRGTKGGVIYSFRGRGERCKTGRLCKTYPKTIKPADPRYKGIMGVMEQETGLT
jgi:hypothetical protein